MEVLEIQEKRNKVIQIVQVLNLSGLENSTRVAIIFITLLAAAGIKQISETGIKQISEIRKQDQILRLIRRRKKSEAELIKNQIEALKEDINNNLLILPDSSSMNKLAALIRAYVLLCMEILFRILRYFEEFLRNHPFSSLLLVVIFLLMYKVVVHRKLLSEWIEALHYLLQEDDENEQFSWLYWAGDKIVFTILEWILQWYDILYVLKKHKKVIIKKMCEKINKKTY